MSSLEKILKERRCFKLVCGAGNEDPVEVERLVAVYAKAGANMFVSGSYIIKSDDVKKAIDTLRNLIQ